MKLAPTPFAVLRYLIERPGQLVTKHELFKAIWPETAVTDWVLSACVYEVRKALGDEARAPRFLETVHRRGYRFVGSLAPPVQSRECELIPDLARPVRTVVGREDEIGRMKGWWDAALAGERQVVFVVGEAGIGKTSLVEAFVARIGSPRDVAVGWGQCIQQYGAGEAYLPVLEALGQLGRGPLHGRVVAVLRQYAPTWLAQMPWLVGEAEVEALQGRIQSRTRERMLREFAEALEVLAAERAVALVLEDLQWSDHATLDFVSYLARRRGDTRLFLLGTYRPAEVLDRHHPLRAVKQEMPAHVQCRELTLEGLSESGVREYLRSRLPHGDPDPGLVRWLHQRTDGHPLFMVNTVDYLLGRGLLKGDDSVPENLRMMIERQLEELSPHELRVLEAASVAGMDFSAAAAAAALEAETVQIEERCQALARRRQFLRSSGSGEWPDGTVAERYAFVHALYQSVLYERIGAARRLRFHHRIGEREEAAYGERGAEIAAELAMHFERGRDHRRAVHYSERAASTAIQRTAYREALAHARRGLELLETLPDTPERARQELLLQMALGMAVMPVSGYASPELLRAYARARELCGRLGETPELYVVTSGLVQFANVRAELGTGLELAEQLLRLAHHQQDSVLLMHAHMSVGLILAWQGDFARSRAELDQGLALYDVERHRSLALIFGQDPGVTCRIVSAIQLWSLGYPDQSRRRIEEALTLARELAHPFSAAFALICASWAHLMFRDMERARGRAEEAIALAVEQGFPLWVAVGSVYQGRAMAEHGSPEEGIARLRQGEAAYRATGAEAGRTHHLALLAEASMKAGRPQDALTALSEGLALAEAHDERFYEPELHRLRGEILRARGGDDAEEAERCFHRAIDAARRRSARSLEVRAVTSVSRLWQRQGKTDEARAILAAVYGWFTEGFDTPDLQEAGALLAELTAPPRSPR